MKTKIFFLLLCLASFWGSIESSAQSSHLRIMSYNVRNCLGMDSVLDYQRVADVIRTADPDLVGLQELDSMTQRDPGKVALSELAERTGMYAVYAPTMDYRGGKYGHGILSKEKPIGREIVPLISSKEPRVMLIVEFPDYFLCNLHLSIHAKDLPESALIIIDRVSRLDKPVFLTGDFNARPTESTIVLLQKYFTPLSDPAMKTSPANNPRATIDYIFFYTARNPEYETSGARVIEEPVASDHRPLVVDVKF